MHVGRRHPCPTVLERADRIGGCPHQRTPAGCRFLHPAGCRNPGKVQWQALPPQEVQFRHQTARFVERRDPERFEERRDPEPRFDRLAHAREESEPRRGSGTYPRARGDDGRAYAGAGRATPTGM